MPARVANFSATPSDSCLRNAHGRYVTIRLRSPSPRTSGVRIVDELNQIYPVAVAAQSYGTIPASTARVLTM